MSASHAALVAEHELSTAPEITTDAKVIPCLVSRRLAAGQPTTEAFRQTVGSFEGSVAICLTTSGQPDELLFALRGSGQALYLGLAEDATIAASEPYGLVEVTDRYLRMDGDTPGNPQNPTASRGQIVRIERAAAGTLEGIHRIAYDGTELPVSDAELTRAAITTRDVDRGEFRHFLLKEISEAPDSLRKTLRGKIVERDGRATVALDESVLPAAVTGALRGGQIRRVLAIGQGTAAVACQGVAAAFEQALRESPITVAALPATELSPSKPLAASA